MSEANMGFNNCQLCGKPITLDIYNNEFDEVYGGCHSICLEEKYNDESNYMDSGRKRNFLGEFTE